MVTRLIVVTEEGCGVEQNITSVQLSRKATYILHISRDNAYRHASEQLLRLLARPGECFNFVSLLNKQTHQVVAEQSSASSDKCFHSEILSVY
jgi:hypothetical protein